jgi:hypothetical protein
MEGMEVWKPGGIEEGMEWTEGQGRTMERGRDG